MTAQATTTPAEQADTATGGVLQRVELLDPRGLLVDVNVRADARVDRDFIASVHDLGVLVPIVAVRTDTGAVRVRFGHRRTRAAVVAGLESVPVVVIADEATSTAGQVERLVTQWAENEHRTGLTLGEQVGVVGQLAAFGVSAAQIAKRTRLARPRVDAALVVAGSTVARAAAVEHDLDLVEAAVVADFAADPEAVDRLVDAAGTGRFDHVAQRLRDDRARTERRAAYTAGLEADGVTVVPPGVLLRDLTDPTGITLTAAAHAGCPRHAAQLGRTWGRIDPATGLPTPATTDERGDAAAADEDDENDESDESDDQDEDDEEPVDDGTVWGEYPVPEWVCTDHAGCGHIRRPVFTSREQTRLTRAEMTPEQADAARAERRDVIESNKAWGSAVVVRQGWVQALLTRKTAPKGTAAFVAAALALDGEVVTRRGGNDLAADLLGCDRGVYGRSPALAALVAQATEARAQVLALAVVLGGYEDATHTGSWRKVDPATARYLQFLAACGYGLADVERRACGQEPLPLDTITDTTGTAAEVQVAADDTLDADGEDPTS